MKLPPGDVMSSFYLNGDKMDKLMNSGSVKPVLSDEMTQKHKEREHARTNL